MITISEYKNTDDFPEELKTASSIDVLEYDIANKKHGMYYYCVIDGKLITVEYLGRILYCLTGLYRNSTCRAVIIDSYEQAGAKIKDFTPYAEEKYLIRKLFRLKEGCTIEEALSFIRENIQNLQGTKNREANNRILFADYGIIVGYDKPLIRRYSDNEKKNTFDLVDINVKVSLHSRYQLKEWYMDMENRKNLTGYALEKIGKDRNYIKFNVPTDYLKLSNVGISADQYRLVFTLKREELISEQN